MAASDVLADAVKTALTKAGWLITDDPLTLSYGGKEVYVDLGAEKVVGAEKDGQRIAVEVKSFVGYSDVKDLRDALGQYIMYRRILEALSSDRILFLAVSEEIFAGIFSSPFGRLFVEREKLNLIVFNPNVEIITQWIRH